MKYHILHDFGTFIPFKRKFSDDFEDLHILKLLRNFDVNLTSFPGRVMNKVLNVKFVTPLGNKVRLTSNFVRGFSL